MAAFNIIANLQLQGPTNVAPVVTAIQNALKGITAQVNITFNPGLNANLTNVNQRLATLNAQLQAVTANATNATVAVQRLAGAFAAVTQANVRFNTTINTSAPAVQATNRAISEGVTGMENFGRAAGLAGRRYSAFLLAGGSIVGFITGLRNAIREAAQFEQQMIRLEQVGIGTRAELASVQSTISNLATGLGISSHELSQAAVLFAAAGVKAKEMAGALEAVAKASLSPSFGNMVETVNGVIAISSQFRISMSNMEAALGGVNAVANEFSVESKDIIEAITRAGGAFRTAGGTLNEFIATFTSVRSTTREGADAIATGLRTIFSSLQRSTTVEALKNLGINLRHTREEAEALGDVGLTEQFVGPYQAVQRLSEALAGLRSTDPRFASIATEIGGLRQLSRVLPLLQETTRAQEAYNIAQAGQVSLQVNADQAQQGTLVRLTKLREEFLALFRTITSTPAWQGFVTTMFTLASGIIKVTEALTPLMPLLISFATIKFAQNIGGLLAGAVAGVGGRAPANAQPVGPRGYASGGVVPGSGNLDTVPAYLTPGEFVVRKQVAQTIGYDRLHSLNAQRFAAGGQAQPKTPAISGRSFIVGETIPVGLVARSGQDSVWKGSINYLDITRRDKAPDPIQDFINDLKNQGVSQKDIPNYIRVRGTVSRSTLVPQRFTEFENNVIPIIKDKITEIFKSLPPLQGQVLPTLSHQSLSTVVGPVFEGYISRLTGKSGSGPNDNFDFPNMTAGQKQQFNKLFAPPVVGDYIDAKSTSTLSATKDIIKKGLNEKIHTIGAFVKKALGGLVTPFANGGMAQGTDIVPAVLTPGEFIMSRDSVAHIGLGNLEYMNATGKARGFASGGLVQHFATGGPVNPTQQSYEDFIGGAQIGGVQALATARQRLLESMIKQQQTADRTLSYEQARQKAVAELQVVDDRVLDANRRIQRALEIEAGQRASERVAGRLRTRAGQAADAGDYARAARLEGRASIVESRAAAQAEAARGLREPSAQVLRGPNGELIGLAGETQDRINSGAITQGTRFQRFRRGIVERAGRIGTTGALLGLPYAAQAFEGFGGTATGAVENRTEGGFIANRAVAGTFQGTATGAAIGSIFGPWGIAIGAAAGATKGLADSITEATTQIKEAKIEVAITELSNRLEQLGSGGLLTSPDIIGGVRSSFASARTGIQGLAQQRTERAYYNPFRYIYGAFNENEYDASSAALTRERFGPQLPRLAQGLNRFASDVGRANPNITGSPLEQRRALDRLTQTFVEGNGGLNRELIQMIANLRRVPFREVETEFRRVIQDTSRGERIRLAERNATQSTGNVVTYFEAFVRSIEQAREAMSHLESQTRALTDDFATGVNAIRAPNTKNVELGGPDAVRFNHALQSITAPFGAGAGLLGGSDLRSNAQAANAVRQLLPQAITTGLARGPLDEQTLSDQVRQILQAGTRGQANQPEIQRYISIAVDNLRRESLDQIIQHAGADVGKLANKIFSEVSNPIQDALNKIAKEIDASSSSLIEGLAEYGQRLQRAGAQQDTAADLRVQRSRFQARLIAESNLEFGQGAELRYFPLAQAQAGLQARQERLTGLGGGAANNPEVINAAINATRAQLVTAVETRDRLSANLTPSNRQSFQNAALAVTTLQTRANSLSQALQNLANVTERNAAIQERLGILDRDREARGSLAERLLTSGPDEINRLTRGGLLAQGAIQAGNLAQLPLQHRQEAVEFLRTAGDTILPGFGNGNLTGGEHLRQLALNTLPELLPGRQQRTERAQLEGQLGASFDTAVRTGDLIAGQTRSAADAFFQRLTQLHTQLFTELRNNQVIMSQLLAVSQRASAVGTRENLRPEERSAALLRRVGLRTQSNVNQFRANLPAVQEFLTSLSREDTLRQQAGNLNASTIRSGLDSGVNLAGIRVGGNGALSLSNEQQGNLRDYISGITQARGGDLTRVYNEIVTGGQNRLAAYTGNVPEGDRNLGNNVLQGQFAQTVLERIQTYLNVRAGNLQGGASQIALNNLTPFLRQIGSNPDEFRQSVSRMTPEERAQLTGDALTRFTDRNPIENLNRRVNEADQAIERFTRTVDELTQQVERINTARQQGSGFAMGGSVFRPRGTDTVPAMLSPGEFVVNARAAQNNLPLLRALNGSNTTVHASGGGMIAYLQNGGDIANENDYWRQVGLGTAGAGGASAYLLWRNRELLRRQGLPLFRSAGQGLSSLFRRSGTTAVPTVRPSSNLIGGWGGGFGTGQTTTSFPAIPLTQPPTVANAGATTIDFVTPTPPPSGTRPSAFQGTSQGWGDATWMNVRDPVLGSGRVYPRPSTPIPARVSNFFSGLGRTARGAARSLIPTTPGAIVLAGLANAGAATEGGLDPRENVAQTIGTLIPGVNLFVQPNQRAGGSPITRTPTAGGSIRANQTFGGGFLNEAAAFGADLNPVAPVLQASNFGIRLIDALQGGQGLTATDRQANETATLNRQSNIRANFTRRNQEFIRANAPPIRDWINERVAEIEATNYTSAPPANWESWTTEYGEVMNQLRGNIVNPSAYQAGQDRDALYSAVGSQRFWDAVQAARALDFLYSGRNENVISWADNATITNGQGGPEIDGVRLYGIHDASAIRMFKNRNDNPRDFIRGTSLQGTFQSSIELMRRVSAIRDSVTAGARTRNLQAAQDRGRDADDFKFHYYTLFDNFYGEDAIDSISRTIQRLGGANSNAVGQLALEDETETARVPINVGQNRRELINQIRTAQGQIILGRLREAFPEDWWQGASSRAAALGGAGWGDVFRQYLGIAGAPEDVPNESHPALYLQSGGAVDIARATTAGRAAFISSGAGRAAVSRLDFLRAILRAGMPEEQREQFRAELARLEPQLQDALLTAGTTGGLGTAVGQQIATQTRLSRLNQILSAGNLLPGQELQYALAGQIGSLEQTYNVQNLRDFMEERQGLGYLTQWRRSSMNARQALAPRGFANGGLVDSVPAMLTPGEFVLNRHAVAAVGAAHLDRINRFADGGAVGGGSGGGTTLAFPADFGTSIARFETSVSSFVNDGLTSMNRALASMQGLAQAFDRIPRSIELSMPAPMNVVVTLNGADVLANMTGPMRELMLRTAREEIVRAFDQRLPDAGRPTFNGTSAGTKPSVNYV